MVDGLVIPALVGAGKTSSVEEFPDDRGVSISKKCWNEAYTTALNERGLRHVIQGEGSHQTTCCCREEHPPVAAPKKIDPGKARGGR